jgi:hypothetical protein
VCEFRLRATQRRSEAADYPNLGGNYFTRRDADRAMRNIIRQANV